MPEEVPVEFTIEELWLLHGCVKHEIQGIREWKFGPASVELNDKIATAILFCHKNSTEKSPVHSAYLLLSRGDLLAIDYCVPQDAKDVDGNAIGKYLLLKTFAARAELTEPYPLPEVEEQVTLPKDVNHG